MNNPSKNPQIAFFGTPDFAVWVLDALKARGIVPNLVVCAPDAPKGRKLVMTPPAAKVWATANNVPVLQPEKIRGQNETPFIQELNAAAEAAAGAKGWDMFIVAAYGKIIPEGILYLPHRKTINVHPSMLPLLRGAAPLQGAILNDMRDTGVTIMLLDKEMDHGPILAQKALNPQVWPIDHIELGKALARDGANLIADLMPSLLDGTAQQTEQDHSKATFTEKVKKEDGLIDLSADGYKNFLRYNAYKGWPGSYFFAKSADGKDGVESRVTITDATFDNGAFSIKKVIPEGKKEMTWAEYEALR